MEKEECDRTTERGLVVNPGRRVHFLMTWKEEALYGKRGGRMEKLMNCKYTCTCTDMLEYIYIRPWGFE